MGSNLEKLGVVDLQVASLTAELRPLLKYSCVYPKSCVPAVAHAVPIMLATRVRR